jgi:glycosyltransferase involved in cell wall biosynthesis
MKVSIITVTRNSAKTLEDTILSVLRQDYPDVEHIIIDGASTDETMAIVRKYRNNIAVTVSEPDMGIYDAMNKGIRKATGDVIGILNSDDVYMHTGVISRMATELERSGSDVIFADLVYVKPEQTERVVRRFSSAGFKPEMLPFGMAPAHPTLFVKKEVFERYGHYKTDYQISADFELMARIFHQTDLKYTYVPETIIKMRLGGVSTRGFSSLLLSNSEMLRACLENGIPTNIFKILMKYPKKARGYFSGSR